VILIAADTETLPFGEGAINPRPVCLTIAGERDWSGYASVDDDFLSMIETLFHPDVTSIWANAKYDLLCILGEYPEITPLVYAALTEGRVHDVIINQRLGNLQTYGRLDGIAVPSADGEGVVAKRFGYSLADLYEEYYGEDISAEKADGRRLAYDALEGLPWAEYPPEFREYALSDARRTWMVHKAQQARWGDLPTANLQVAADFALGRMTQRGVALDKAEFYRLRDATLAARDWHNFPTLLSSGVLRAPTPPLPYKAQRKRVCAELGCPPDRDFLVDPLTDEEKMQLEGASFKLTTPKGESADTKALRSEVERVCNLLGREVLLTPTECTSTESDFLEELKGHSEVIAEYVKRQEFGKIITTELPRMCRNRDLDDPADVVHPGFWILKETGRTSSSATDAYPSFNCQNVDPRARGCYVARSGMLLCSVDFGSQDLVSLAQRCLDVLGRSRLAENFNAGVDPHGYLGSVLATQMAGRGAFTYDSFMALAQGDDDARTFWKHWRTFAKPTGLGFPGGLGAATFVKYARGTFGVETDENEAIRIKEAWFAAYPEMTDYFRYVSEVLQTGDDEYSYTSPLGMVRSHTTYCAACNGFGLQTPSAEATKLATWNLDRASFDKSAGNALLFKECWPVMQIHDEIIVELRDDEHAHDRAHEIARIMRESMWLITPDVVVKAEPALMRRWRKGMDPTYVDGRLVISEDES